MVSALGVFVSVARQAHRDWGLVRPAPFRWHAHGNWRPGLAPSLPTATIPGVSGSELAALRSVNATITQRGRHADGGGLYLSISPNGGRHPRHISSWEMTMRVYAAPLRHLPVDRITADDVLSVLKPLWTKLPETASRLRGRIERVLDAAKAQGLRTGENPARWRGHLDQLLPQRQAITRGHYEALRYEDVPACIDELRSRQSIPSLALEFIILTAARCGEAVGARWDEVNLESGVWTVPVSRMKAARQHRVPLSRRAREILAIMRELHHGEYVFPSSRHHGKPLGARTVWWAIRAIRTGGATVHGFRSSFRDWAAECTDFSNEVCEAALAHAVTNKVEAAYRRGDLFEKRRKLMDAWAGFCEPKAVPQVADKDLHTL
jgi:integrase